MAYIVIKGDELYHHGVKGMHWGVRRYQNKDGSLTSAGRKRYTDYKPAIKEYRDSYDKASSMNDAADAKWRDVQAARKELGRTAIGRTIASARNKTEAAKKYNRMYDEWSKMQDDADEQWRDADEKYKHTGGNRLTRIANNIRYDTKLGSAKSGEKKQLTDEEKAARNAKIKKAAVAVGAVAATAALTYAGHKYLKDVSKTADSELKKLVDEHISLYDEQMMAHLKISDDAKRSIKSYHSKEAIDSMTNIAKEHDRLAAEMARNRKTVKEKLNNNANSKAVRKAARNAVIKNDISARKKQFVNNSKYKALLAQKRGDEAWDLYRNNIMNAGSENRKKMRDDIDDVLVKAVNRVGSKKVSTRLRK